MSCSSSIESHVRQDRAYAIEIRNSVREELARKTIDPVAEDFTGTSVGLRQFRLDAIERRAALADLSKSLFFRKIEVGVTDHRGLNVGVRTYLLSKVRGGSPHLPTEGVFVAGWTDGVSFYIRDEPVGECVEWVVPKFRLLGRTEQFVIKARGVFAGAILPEIRDAEYELECGAYRIDSVGRVLAATDSEASEGSLHESRYEAASDFGLQEIISLADADQWKTMHQPFGETVLVEGPPGSGKTSIGLMRVPCLIDRQWDELGLDRAAGSPFHSVDRMRVLVMNEEMVQYLDSLMASIGVQGLRVETLSKFARSVCREAHVLGGTTVRESSLLTRIKHDPRGFRVIWTGFCTAAMQFRSETLPDLIADMAKTSPSDADSLSSTMEAWFGRLQACTRPNATGEAPNLAASIRRWYRVISEEALGLGENESGGNAVRPSRLGAAQDLARRLVVGVFDRPRIIRATIESHDFVSLVNEVAPGRTKELAEEWLGQTQHDVQQISDGDLLLHSLLAAHLMLIQQSRGALGVGIERPNLTHVMVDEAQDLSNGHVDLVRRLLHSDGTMTLVGDLRQRVTHPGYFSDWSELNLGTVVRAVFDVNHRQSAPLGAFVCDLYRALYSCDPDWRPSARRRDAPLPRIRTKRGFVHLADLVAKEVDWWREKIPGATVGILFHGKPWPRDFSERIEVALSNSLTEVRVASVRGHSELSQTDCAILATVENTKGLEFDAVVVVDRHGKWKGLIGDLAEIERNGLYVAASRAKQGLSMILDDRSELLSKLDPAGFELIPASSLDGQDGETDE